MFRQSVLKDTINQNIFKDTGHFPSSNNINPYVSNVKPFDNSFTPPFIKLHPLKMKFARKEHSNNTSEQELQQGDPTIKKRVLTNKDEQLFDLIYDHVLGCYYDPKTEIYYELKEK